MLKWKRANMIKISVIIPDELNKRLRHAIVERLGSQKGALTKAIIEGIELWLEQPREKGKRK